MSVVCEWSPGILKNFSAIEQKIARIAQIRDEEKGPIIVYFALVKSLEEASMAQSESGN